MRCHGYKTGWVMKIVTAVFVLGVSFCSAFAAEKPEIFVQTGHAGGVKFVAINQSGTYLVTWEHGFDGSYIKIWDTATGKEIRTVKLETKYGLASNIYFIDVNRFIVFYQKSAEIFDLYGQRIESIKLPETEHVHFNPVIGKDRQYLVNKSSGEASGTKFYSMKDGSEISLPELRTYKNFERYQNDVADLGCGYFGVFHKGESPKGNVDYVIYDDNLNIRKKGSLNIPDVSFGSRFKVSSDLKILAYQGYERSDLASDLKNLANGVHKSRGEIFLYNLETGEQLLSYKPRKLAKSGTAQLPDEVLYFGFIPDGRLRVEYDRQNGDINNFSVRMEMILINPAKGGIYSEKKLVLDGLVGDIAFENHSNPYMITDKGMFAGYANGNVRMTDINTGTEIKSFGVKPSVFFSSYCVGNRILNFEEDFSVSATPKYSTLRFNLWDMGAAGLIKLNVTTETGLYKKRIKVDDDFSPSWFYTEPESLYSQIPADFLKEDYKKEDDYGQRGGIFKIMKNTGDFTTTRQQHKLVLMSKKSKQKLADLYAFEDGEWIIMTPDGYYSASANGDRYLNVRVGNNVYGIENYREAFFRPDLVKVALSGGSLKDYRNLADVKQPPKVSIVQTPDTTAAEEFKLTLRLEEQGGGIGDVRLFLNGSTVMLDNGRGMKVTAKDEKGASYRSYTLKLSPGNNTIRAIAFNAENSMQSNDATHQVTASFTSTRKPTMHALVIGIQEFRNPKLTLKYAVADANLFAETLRAGATGLFEQVQITTLTAREATTRDGIISALQRFKTINPDDLFILYIASHGTVDDGEYFMITSNVGALSTQRLKSDALSQVQLKELVANIPSTKKLIVIDTCNAAALGDAIQVAMLTRGMSEDTAMKVLSRAVGSTILSASTSVQEALEGYQGHGLFTWAVTQGMQGKADKGGSGFVKTTDLAAYVEDEVPNLAERIFKRSQFPTVSISGQGFPVGRVR